MIKNNGEKILLLPNGQKEIHTEDHKVININTKQLRSAVNIWHKC